MYPFALLAALGKNFPDDVLQYNTRTNHRAVLLDNGDLYVQGDGTNGGLGNGSTSATYVMTWTRVLTDVKRFALGPYITLALKNDGTFWFTGGSSGAAGPNISNSLVFVDVTTKLIPTAGPYTAADIVDFKIDNSHTMVLLANGDLWGGGGNAQGQLGTGNTTAVNTIIKIASGVQKVEAGLQFTAYLTTTGDMYFAGLYATRYGLGGATANKTTFTKLASIYPPDPTIVKVNDFWLGKDTSGNNAFMLSADNNLGNGTSNIYMIGNRDDTVTPATNTLSKYNFLSEKVIKFNAQGSSASGSYVINADGVIYALGNNTSGMLGVGSTTTPISPTAQVITLPAGITAADIQEQTFDGTNQQFVAHGQLYRSGAGNIFDTNAAVSVLTKVDNFPKL